MEDLNRSSRDGRGGVWRCRYQPRNPPTSGANENSTSWRTDESWDQSSRALVWRRGRNTDEYAKPWRTERHQNSRTNSGGTFDRDGTRGAISRSRNREDSYGGGRRGSTGASSRESEVSDSSGLRHSQSNQNLTSRAGESTRRRPKIVEYKRRLENSITQSPTDIVTNLVNTHFGFLELFSSPLEPDLLILVIRALSKACDSNFEANKTALLIMICQSKLLRNIQNHLTNMPIYADKRNQSVAEFICDLLKLFEVIMDKLPNTATEKLENIFINADLALVGLKKYKQIELPEQKDTLDYLFRRLRDMIQERETKKDQTDSKQECMRYNRPPDDFREKTLYPTLEDLFSEKTPFVRPNIIEGAYEDVEDYLDIQFRLLREDFVSPLRDGLKKYLDNSDYKKTLRIDNIRIYKNVTFGDPKVVKDSFGIVVNFDPDKQMNIRWEYSKRFMFGSLLVFANDNFKTILFGTVLDRDLQNLQSGQIIVRLHESDDKKLYETTFVMLESEVYFEPYKHVMKALQGLNENNFPMKKYIVSVKNDIDPPKYLLLSPFHVYAIGRFEIQVLNNLKWPGALALQLDVSQHTAFKAALTKEFVVIQGPPGTGKTFLGLKITKVLLQNPSVWNSNQTPILVVCYTNHALDQFLEGIVQVTDKIVRVGGQSKSQVLSKFNLRELRRNYDFKASNSQLKRELHLDMTQTMKAIKIMQVNLEEICKNQGVISLKTFLTNNVIQEVHSSCFQTENSNSDEVLCSWLQEGMHKIKLTEVQQKTQNSAYIIDQNDEVFEEESIEVKARDFDNELFDFGNIIHNLEYALDLGVINSQKEKLLERIEEGESSLKMQYKHLKILSQYWTACLEKNEKGNTTRIQRLLSCSDLWELCPEERWLLYKEWVSKLTFLLRDKIHELKDTYIALATRYEEVKKICDYAILKDSLIVGMTTTNAARDQDLLEALKPKIVIVEEEAEVLESHIVVSLTNNCEHVILIGDHQQLRPAPAVYRLARKFHLDVSLFERLVKNGLPCYSLENQHRMRPEISALIKPAIYPNLQNDPFVYSYPPVRGVSRSLFFVTHNVPEEYVEDISSRRNGHEADFLLALCRYLLLQGYLPEEITILATYKGQMFYMKQRQKNNPSIKGVHITVVDNYQGEENKIILLSLVRSNDYKKIGFLNTENRVCVALSRAKEGLYIIGNMDILAESSAIWPKIKETLVNQQSLGPHLILKCQIHLQQLTSVACGDDFKRVPEGGCLLPCLAILPCGHKCDSICHVNNREHKEYKCHKPCQRSPAECPLDHQCPKRCFENCGECNIIVKQTLPCGHQKMLPCYVDYKVYKCLEEVDVKFLLCGHKVKKPCFQNLDTFPCPVPCPYRLPCGHSCLWKCHTDKDPDHLEYICPKPCGRKAVGCSKSHLCPKKCHEECVRCEIEVTKNLPNCNHTHKMKCFEETATVKCIKKCNKKMKCGHICPRVCYEVCGGCQIQVEKVIPQCQHTIETKCCEPPDPRRCRKPCRRLLACGHVCSRPCGLPCNVKCQKKVQCLVTPLCGHNIYIPCHMKNVVDSASEELLALCEVPCGKELKCGHNCKGSCGECMQGRIHAPCREKCGRPLICGHLCRVDCSSSCPPCTADCQYRCKHSKCNLKCGVPCNLCKEDCEIGCDHQRCSKKCFEPCDMKPCKEPCLKMLKCGHNCIGFCGDQCPPLCRICNKDEVTSLFFGNEDEEDARFVYLVDCKHTIESDGLEKWLKSSGDEITLKKCPKCSSYILHTERYMNDVKRNLEDVHLVKKSIFGEWKRLDSKRQELLNNIGNQDQVNFEYIKKNSNRFDELSILFQNELQSIRLTPGGHRRNYLSEKDLQCLDSAIDVYTDLVHTISSTIIISKQVLKENIKKRMFFKFDLLLNKIKERYTQLGTQETSDFNQECKRFLRMAQLAVVESSENFEHYLRNSKQFKTLYDEAFKIVHGIEIYSQENHDWTKIYIDFLRKSLGSSRLSEKERREIVQAVGVKQGAWFKCRNGHIYCIGECGGAMQVAKCPECGAQIGGTNHSLLRSNTLATEMDGARYSAWPNMH